LQPPQQLNIPRASRFKYVQVCIHDYIQSYLQLRSHQALCSPPVHSSVRRSAICRVNLAPLDLAESNSRRLLNLTNDLGVALSSIARSSRATIEPLHEAALVPPDGESKNHTASERVTHALEAAERVELCGTALCVAEGLVHGDVDRGVLDDHSVLDVLAHNGLEHTILGRKLGDDGERLGGVDLEARAVVELVVAVEVWVVAAAVLVANTLGTALVSTRASEGALFATSVGCDLVGAAVGLPDVHLVAAHTVTSNVTLVKS
jgi:hypothetical protein